MNIYVTERFDLAVLRKQTTDADKKLGSLKRLELLLSQKDSNAHNIISPLFIIYDMRIIDSHDVNDVLPKVNLDFFIKANKVV